MLVAVDQVQDVIEPRLLMETWLGRSVTSPTPAFSKAFKRLVGANPSEHLKRGLENQGDGGMVKDL
jgi:hypothetical protein